MQNNQTATSYTKKSPQSLPATPTIFYVDDDEAMCSSVAFLLDSINISVQTFNSAQAFLKQYSRESSGCLLLDIRMPGMSGLELQEKLNKEKIAIPIIFITAHGDMSMAIRAMKAGAIDFMTKPFSNDLLIKTIQNAIKISDNLYHDKIAKEEIARRVATLTPREFEIMEYVTGGYMNKQTAYKLDISAKTVELHRAKVMEKMQTKSLAQLVKFALVYAGSAEPNAYWFDNDLH